LVFLQLKKLKQLEDNCPRLVWSRNQYIFLIIESGYRKIMSKTLEMLGFVLVAIMILGFVGVFQPTVEPGLSPLFWGCAGATLMILVYRKKKKKQTEAWKFFWMKKLNMNKKLFVYKIFNKNYRQIYKGGF